MTSHYEVLRPVEPGDLATHPKLAEVLARIPPDGYVTFEMFLRVGRSTASRGLAHACTIGVLKRVSPYERILKQNNVKFWSA